MGQWGIARELVSNDGRLLTIFWLLQSHRNEYDTNMCFTLQLQQNTSRSIYILDKCFHVVRKCRHILSQRSSTNDCEMGSKESSPHLQKYISLPLISIVWTNSIDVFKFWYQKCDMDSVLGYTKCQWRSRLPSTSGLNDIDRQREVENSE